MHHIIRELEQMDVETGVRRNKKNIMRYEGYQVVDSHDRLWTEWTRHNGDKKTLSTEKLEK